MDKSLFVQIFGDVLERSDLTSTDKLVYGLLMLRQGENDDSFWGLRSMGKDISKSPEAIRQSVNHLKIAGLIKVKNGKPSTKGSAADTSRYRVDRQVELTLNDTDRQAGLTLPSSRVDADRQVELTKKKHTKVTTKEKEEKAVSASSKTKPQEVVDYWNAKAQDGKLPKIQKLTQDRKKRLNARLKDSDFAEGYRSIIDRIFVTPFLTGENDRGWKADFDWFIRNDDNPVKVMEGKYDGNDTGRGLATPDLFKHRNMTEDEKREFLYPPEDS